MMRPRNTPLHLRPKAFEGIGMHGSTRKLADAMGNRVRAESASRLFNHGPNALSLHSNPIQPTLDAQNLVGKVQSDSISQKASK